MLRIPGEYLLSFVVLVMGVIAFYAGSHSQEEWNEMVIFAYDRSPIRRKTAKGMGAIFIILGTCMLGGLLLVGPEFLAFLK